ncbi:hypothetical protein [Rhodococcus jostii]|nr:hypothetical protein [Rhodococcus jostii]
MRILGQKGFEVGDTFSCRGFDTGLAFAIVDGIHKGLPGVTDLESNSAIA